MVARWHESQQKAGFKFLVTQIMGYQARAAAAAGAVSFCAYPSVHP